MKLIVSTFLVYKVKKCLLKSGKVKFRRRGMLPETLHNCARSSRHLCPKYSVNSTRFLGHKCSCPWGVCFSLFFMLFEGNIVFLGRNIVLFEENIAFFVEMSYVFWRNKHIFEEIIYAYCRNKRIFGSFMAISGNKWQ